MGVAAPPRPLPRIHSRIRIHSWLLPPLSIKTGRAIIGALGLKEFNSDRRSRTVAGAHLRNLHDHRGGCRADLDPKLLRRPRARRAARDRARRLREGAAGPAGADREADQLGDAAVLRRGWVRRRSATRRRARRRRAGARRPWGRLRVRHTRRGRGDPGGIIAGAGAIPGFIGLAYLVLWLARRNAPQA